MESPLFVTRPCLPDLKELNTYLEKIWDNKMLTNEGPFHNQLEVELAKYLGVSYVSLFANGSLALMAALQTIKVREEGEIITTPFSFVATTNAVIWNNMTPVFCDINPVTCTIDTNKIEPLITSKTKAILPVHVYGYPCQVEAIAAIAKKHNLTVIYDAAHTFGVRYREQSLLNYGDLSVLSFHATKIFHTLEGGAIISHTKAMKDQIDLLRNHGILDETTVELPGMNSKMNEIQAAVGLLQLKTIEDRIAALKNIFTTYTNELSDVEGITTMNELEFTKHNYAYFPIFIDSEKFGMNRDEVFSQLKNKNIFARRYFYPLISNFSCYKDLPSSQETNLPVSNYMASRVLCLPNYAELTPEEIAFICKSLKALHKSATKPYLANA